jgi:hypothetical protein
MAGHGLHLVRMRNFHTQSRVVESSAHCIAIYNQRYVYATDMQEEGSKTRGIITKRI